MDMECENLGFCLCAECCFLFDEWNKKAWVFMLCNGFAIRAFVWKIGVKFGK